jgi:uncharacterized damage-inducible protein DinB
VTELAIWFERKFSLDFPVAIYPNLRVRLRGAPARLEELTRGLTAHQLTRKPEGKWSLQEHAGHLLDLEALWLARVDDFLNGAEVLTAADLTNRKTHEAQYNDRQLDEILVAFRRARETLVGRLEGLAAADFARVSKHPRLNQPMRLVDHLYFAAEHDDHHLARIWELARGD